jgi:hypothetical protein
MTSIGQGFGQCEDESVYTIDRIDVFSPSYDDSQDEQLPVVVLTYLESFDLSELAQGRFVLSG